MAEGEPTGEQSTQVITGRLLKHTDFDMGRETWAVQDESYIHPPEGPYSSERWDPTGRSFLQEGDGVVISSPDHPDQALWEGKIHLVPGKAGKLDPEGIDRDQLKVWARDHYPIRVTRVAGTGPTQGK
jgi:hypothetical protein